jgi:hypothetical protein
MKIDRSFEPYIKILHALGFEKTTDSRSSINGRLLMFEKFVDKRRKVTVQLFSHFHFKKTFDNGRVSHEFFGCSSGTYPTVFMNTTAMIRSIIIETDRTDNKYYPEGSTAQERMKK